MPAQPGGDLVPQSRALGRLARFGAFEPVRGLLLGAVRFVTAGLGIPVALDLAADRAGVAAQQAAAAGHSTMQEMMLLTIHGILHLLGYDHVTPEQERQMFGLQRQLLLTFLAVRRITIEPATLPKGAADALAEYDASHGGGRQITE